MMKQNNEEISNELNRSPENKGLKSLPKAKNIYEKYSILKKSPPLNKVSFSFHKIIIRKIESISHGRRLGVPQ